MQWVLRAQCHDREALELLLREVQPSLRRYLAGLAGTDDAEDLLQDTLLIIVRRLGSLEDPALFRPWAFRITSRVAFRHVKRRRRWRESQEIDVQLDELPALETRPSGELLSELLASSTISPASRAVLVLHFQEELTLGEVAAILEIPLGTAKSRLAYGLKSIRRSVKGSGGSNG